MTIEIRMTVPYDDSLHTSVFNSWTEDQRKGFKAVEAVYGKRAVNELKLFIKAKGGLMCIFNRLPMLEIHTYFAVSIAKAMEVRERRTGKVFSDGTK